MENSEKMKEQMTITEQIERFKKMKKDFFGEHYDPSMTLMENADARTERNTRIEEMAKAMANVNPNETATAISTLFVTLSEILYNEGYRKQKEGEWVRDKEDCLHNKCSVCGYGHCREDNFCPNCGAKMKGGAE